MVRGRGSGEGYLHPCGSEIVRGDGRTLAARIRALGGAVGVKATIARDGLRLAFDAPGDDGRSDHEGVLTARDP
jgi:hypothetical protein